MDVTHRCSAEHEYKTQENVEFQEVKKNGFAYFIFYVIKKIKLHNKAIRGLFRHNLQAHHSK